MDAVSWLLLVLALCSCVEILQDALQVIEGGAVLWLVLPALQHDLIEFSGTAVEALHSVAFLQGTDHLWIGHSYKTRKNFQPFSHLIEVDSIGTDS